MKLIWLFVLLMATTTISCSLSSNSDTDLEMLNCVDGAQKYHDTKPTIVEGSGSEVLYLEDDFAKILHIEANARDRYFGILSVDSENNFVDLLVNTNDVYNGVIPVNFEGEVAVRINIDAVGQWRIAILSPSAAPVLQTPGIVYGEGDCVVRVTGGATSARVVGNTHGGSIFRLWQLRPKEGMLISTTRPVDKHVTIARQTTFLRVKAVGEWSITVR